MRRFKICTPHQILMESSNQVEMKWAGLVARFRENRNTTDFFEEILNHLTPNGHYIGRTTQLTSRCYILYIYSTNTRTEYFKHAA